MSKLNYKSITISANISEPVVEYVDIFADLKNTKPVISFDGSDAFIYFPLSESLKYKLLQNNQNLFLYLVTDKFCSTFRLKSRKRNRKPNGLLSNKTLPRGYIQSTCHKTTDINYSFSSVSKVLIPNKYINISVFIDEIILYLKFRKEHGKLFTGRYNHYCYKNHPETAYFKFYLSVAPSYDFNFNIMGNKGKCENIYSQLSIPIVVFASVLNSEKYIIQLETINDYKHGKIEELYCLTIR